MEQLRKVYRLVRWLSLAGLVVTVLLLLKSPAPVAQPLDAGQIRKKAGSFQQKLSELARAQSSGESGTEVHFTAAEVNAAMAQATASPDRPQPASHPIPHVADEAVPIKSTQVSFEDDLVKGQFLTQIYGKDVYITVAGRLGSHNGYATFDPTEFKVGDFSVPVSLVNPALQHKLADPENHEKMKLPEFVRDLRVENGELVISD